MARSLEHVQLLLRTPYYVLLLQLLLLLRTTTTYYNYYYVLVLTTTDTTNSSTYVLRTYALLLLLLLLLRTYCTTFSPTTAITVRAHLINTGTTTSTRNDKHKEHASTLTRSSKLINHNEEKDFKWLAA